MRATAARYWGNLDDRRKIAEYSRQAGWKATKEEVTTYTPWAGESVKWFLENIKKSETQLAFEEQSLIDPIYEVFRSLGIPVGCECGAGRPFDYWFPGEG
jgi:hypothetical protein